MYLVDIRMYIQSSGTVWNEIASERISSSCGHADVRSERMPILQACRKDLQRLYVRLQKGPQKLRQIVAYE
jgi:hypothetical protein